ncbi:hypothetical protein GCM10010954_24380 [Halobacillus andaensis]|uniref:Uncharacterized protein n=1 Tax=Halobacillus andaensis TaxID=1176239 RepID=A0A917B5V8_HALAA|nr:hypothetical protein [Halobacillus andaensis]MBP2005973.1 putative membrane protein [Halobacillus andaensis]GGF24612.1 hypothetical protein GCM10010954_24380 [Halobacillus andaensis]
MKNRLFTHIFNIAVGLLLIIEGGVYIFTNNNEGDLHLQSIIMTVLLFMAWGMSYRKQATSDNQNAWLIFTIIIMIPMILPFLFFI